MMTFYAAVGSYRIRKEDGRLVPYIQKLGRLHPISIPEFVIWTTLLWEVMTYRELKDLFEKQMEHFNGPAPDFDMLLNMLKKRKLIACGLGYSGSDALYNMLSDAFVIPYHMAGGRKAWSVYPEVQRDCPEDWAPFMRRITGGVYEIGASSDADAPF